MEKRAKVALAMIRWMNKRFCLSCDAGIYLRQEYGELFDDLDIKDECRKEFFEKSDCWYTQDLLEEVVKLLPD